MNVMKLNPFELTQQIPFSGLRQRALDVIMNLAIPFNRWLGFRILEASSEKVVVMSPPTKLRENHVGGAHACALALMGEYAAGLCVAKHYGMTEYRLIIGQLSIDYHKQGRGRLWAEALAPETWPEVVEGEAWIEMTTQIQNQKGESIATCRTKWQLKKWDKVRSS